MYRLKINNIILPLLLALQIISCQKKNKILNNLLFSDDRNVYQQIKPTKTGFQISAEQGSSSKFYSNIFFSKNKVDSVGIESWSFVQYKKSL